MSTALEEATARCASLMDSSSVHVTLPNGLNLPASPENRAHARKLWAEENGSPGRDEDQASAERARIQSLEEQMKGMAREHQRALDDANQQLQHERARATEIENEQLRAQEQRAREREDEQRARDKIEHETEMLRYRLQHVDEVNKLKDELRIATELKPADGTARTRTGMNPAADLAEREAVRIEAVHSSLALNHPASDAMIDFSNCVSIQPELRQESGNGRSSVTTVQELFDKTNEKAPDMKRILLDIGSDSSIAFSIQKYRTVYYSKKKPDKRMMLVSIVLAMSEYLPRQKNRVSAALKAAASLSHADRAAAVQIVKDTGVLPLVSKEMTEMKLAELPGIIEMIASENDSEIVSSFEHLITAYVSFQRNVPELLRKSEDAWSQLDGTTYDECEDLVTDEERAFGNCTSWFGKSVCTDFHRFEHLITICPQIVQQEYINLLTNPETTETELSMMNKENWTEYLTVFRKAWSTAQCRMDVQSRFVQSTPKSIETWSQRTQVQKPPTNAGDRRFNNISNLQPDGITAVQDMPLQCVQCHSEFMFSVSSQQHHKEMGWQTLPGKGPCCRDWDRFKCSLYDETDECRFGSSCRYSHNKPTADVASESVKLPGSINSDCRRFPNCPLGDKCSYKHKDRALQQQAEAEKLKRNEFDNFRGLPIKEEKKQSVRFRQ